MSNYPVRFGKYVLLERVNTGGMAEVFKAKTTGVTGLGRILAIKRILPNLVEDDEFIRMFIDEARIAVQLNHQNIIQIYELGKHADHYYIAMEYIPSRDLRAILDRMRTAGQLMSIAQAAFIIRKVCDGLDYAHKKRDASGTPMNIIHRDVSPQNILVGFEGEVKVIDFGIAKAANRSSRTQAGVLKGKFGYMSPEQVRGLPTDRRSDLFAVGVLLYEMLTGERLFVGESDFSTLEKVRNAEVTPPSHYNKKITPQLEQVVLRALAREVEDRYQWASEFAADLEPFAVENKQPYTSRRLSSTMKESYAAEFALERQKNDSYLDDTGESAQADQRASTASSSILPIHGPKSEISVPATRSPRMPRNPTPAMPKSAPGPAEQPGADKTYVIESSVAGLELHRDVTDEQGRDVRRRHEPMGAGPPATAPTGTAPTAAVGGKAVAAAASEPAAPRPVTLSGDGGASLSDDDEYAEQADAMEDDARTIVGGENPFHEGSLGSQGSSRRTTGEDDDEIDASEVNDVRSSPPSVPAPPQPASERRRGHTPPDPPPTAPTARDVAPPRRPAPMPVVETAERDTPSKDRAPQRPLFPGHGLQLPSLNPSMSTGGDAAVVDEDELARLIIQGTTGGRPGDALDATMPAKRNADSELEGQTAARWDDTHVGVVDGHTTPESGPASVLADVSQVGGPVRASIPAHLMRVLIWSAAASVTFLLSVTSVLVMKLTGTRTSTVELYAIGPVQPPDDLTISVNDVMVGRMDQPFMVAGEARVRIAGTGVRPVVRLVRATGAPMRQPVMFTALEGSPAAGERAENVPVTAPAEEGVPDGAQAVDAERAKPARTTTALPSSAPRLGEPKTSTPTPRLEPAVPRNPTGTTTTETRAEGPATDGPPRPPAATLDKGAEKNERTPTTRVTVPLQVGTRPAAEMSVDGRSVGTTPFYAGSSLRIEPGKHRIEFLVKSSGKRFRYDVVVSAATEEKKLVVDFGKPHQPRITGGLSVKFTP